MRSVNIGKIATVAAGAALLGAALAGAVQVDTQGLGSAPLFHGSAVNAKVVVGSTSAPSDGVAAANIAAMLGNLAYTSTPIKVTGLDQVTCAMSANSTNSTGTTTGVQVTATVTTPGVNPNLAYLMKTYVNSGYLDVDTTDNRVAASSVGSILTTSGTSDGRKITAYETPLAFRGSITDPVSGTTYTEDERYFASATTAYDDNVVGVDAQNVQLGYEVQFTNPIQFCTNAIPSAVNTVAGCDDTHLTQKHNLKVKFLGSDWVIFGLTFGATTGLGTAGTDAVTLGKYIAYKEFMKIGDSASAPNGYTIKLVDVQLPTGSNFKPAAVFSITDSNGNEVKRITLQELGTTDFTQYGLTIHLYESVFSQTGESYARVAVFSDKLVITDSSQVQWNGDSNSNLGWNARIVTGGTGYGPSVSRIQLTRTSFTNFLQANQSVTFINNPANMQLTFQGLEPTQYDTLSFQSIGLQPLPVQNSATNTEGSGTKPTVVRITSGNANAFTLTPPGGSSIVATSGTLYWVTGYSYSGANQGAAIKGEILYGVPSTSYFAPYIDATALVNSTIPVASAITGSSLANVYVNFSGNTTVVGCIYTGNGTTVNFANNASIVAFSGVAGALSAATVNSGLRGYLTTLTAQTGAAPTGAINLNATHPGVNLYPYAASNSSTFTLTSGATAIGACNSTSGTVQINFNVGSLGALTNSTPNYVYNNTAPYQYSSSTRNIDFNTEGINTAGDVNSTMAHSIYVQEYRLDTDDTTNLAAILLDVGYGDSSGNQPDFIAANSGTNAVSAYLQRYYNGNLSAQTTLNGQTEMFTGYTTVTSGKSGYVTGRGNVIMPSSTTVQVNYAKTLAHALYTLSAVANNVTAGTATVSGGVGTQLLNSNGYVVTVKSIGTGGSTGGSATYTPDTAGVAADPANADSVLALNAKNSPLVVLDSQASSTEPLIVVGGPAVNSVAASVIGAQGIAPGSEAVVKVVGSKVIVAGYTAQDTTDAANALIQWLSDNRATLPR